MPALINSGIPSDKFAFEGFLPVKKGRKTRLKTLSSEERTMIFYESPHKILKTLNDFKLNFGSERKISISRELTKVYEENIRGTVEEVISFFGDKKIKGEIVIVVEGNKKFQMKWVEEKNIDSKAVKHLSSELKINTLLSKMLVRRNIKTYDEAKSFFRPKFEDLHDPFLMKDMDVASKRISQAITNKESLMVFGDYDVDGTSSVAMMSLYLESKGIKTLNYLPDRKNEGYGISIKAIDIAFEKNIKLIIALDCGIKAHKQISYAKEKNIDFIICDHHNPSDKIPDAYAILNPKRTDCNYPFKELCGCGVGFKLIQAIEQISSDKKEIINYLDLVALAIAADVVPLIGENRILAYLGLQIINSNPKLGIHSLLKTNPKKEYVLSDLMFFLAPRINAAGRIKHAKLASDLFSLP